MKKMRSLITQKLLQELPLSRLLQLIIISTYVSKVIGYYGRNTGKPVFRDTPGIVNIGLKP